MGFPLVQKHNTNIRCLNIDLIFYSEIFVKKSESPAEGGTLLLTNPL